MKVLVEHDVTCVQKLDKDGRTPVYVACYHGNFEILKLLVENGGIYYSYYYSATCNTYAYFHTIVLVTIGDVQKCRNNGKGPVYVACTESNLDCLGAIYPFY